jgi:hypothetical protein
MSLNNVSRLHSELGYRSPEDFEKESQRESQRTLPAAMMTVFALKEFDNRSTVQGYSIQIGGVVTF